MTTAAHDQEIAAIEAVIADAQTLQFDVDGYIGLLDEDVSVVNFFGRRVRGRENLRTIMREAMASPLADVRTTHEVVDVRLVRPDVALAAVVKHVFDEREGADPLHADRGMMTFVLIKQQGRWLISSAQTTPIKAP